MLDGRPSWTEYFMDLANGVATRATCLRRKVGCVVVGPDHRVLVTGYNGSPAGAAHCLDVGCLMVEGHCVRTNHAEANALATAAMHGVSLKGSTVYVTTQPCFTCGKLLDGAGVKEVYYLDAYGPWPMMLNINLHKVGSRVSSDTD